MQRERQVKRIFPSVAYGAAVLGVGFLCIALHKAHQGDAILAEHRTLLQEQGETAEALLEVISADTSSEQVPSSLESWRLRGLLKATELSVVFARDTEQFKKVAKNAVVVDARTGKIKSTSRSFRAEDFTNSLRTTLKTNGGRAPDNAFWIEGENVAWAVSPLSSDSHRTLLRIPLSEWKAVTSGASSSKGKVQSALVRLAEGIRSRSRDDTASSFFWLLVAGMLLLGVSLLIFVRLRFREPLNQLAYFVKGWLSGEKGLQLSTDKGDSSVRELSRLVNQMVEQVDVRRQGRLRGIADGAFALATSLRMVGQGDLKLIPPTVPDELSPIASASEEMISALNASVEELYVHSTKAVNHLRSFSQGTIQTMLSLHSQMELLEKLGAECEAHTAKINEFPETLTQSLAEIENTLTRCNSAAQQVRMGVAVVVRKSHGVTELTQQLKSGLVEAAALEKSIQLLSILSDTAASSEEKESAAAQSANVVRAARDAFEKLKQLTGAVHHDVEDMRRGLGGLSIEILPEVDTPLEEPSKILSNVMREVSSNARQIQDILALTSKNNEQLAESFALIAKSFEGRNELAQSLDRALSRFDLDGQLDAELIARLEAARKQYAELSNGELSEDAVKMTKELAASVNQSQQRITKMLDALEATANAVRNSST